MVFPPRNGTISIPAVIAGNTLQCDDTSITASDTGFDGSLIMKTQNKLAMIIDPDQSVSINTERNASKLTINTDNLLKPILRLSYQNSYYFDTLVTSNGNVIMNPSCDNLTLDPNLTTAIKKNVNIIDHNGTHGLLLGSILVTSSAYQLNYTNVSEGVATSNKAIVLNSSKEIRGIHYLSSDILDGRLAPGPQLNITEIDKLNIVSELSLNGLKFPTNTINMLTYLDINTIGLAQPSKALIVDSNKNIRDINNVSANTFTGVLTTGEQPNITTLNSLNQITVTGLSKFNNKVTIGSTNGDVLQLNYIDPSSIIQQNTRFELSNNGDLKILSTGETIQIDNNLNFRISSHDGTRGLMLGSYLVTATATQLNYTKVIPGVVSESKALVVDVNKNINGLNLIGANAVSGIIQTPIQPMITSVNVLDISNHNGTIGLSLGGVVVTSNALQLNTLNTTPGIAQASKAIVLNSTRSITNINTLSANILEGTIHTNYQPNITTLDSLRINNHNGISDGLVLGSVLVTSSANQLNYVNVTPGMAFASRALVLDTNKDITGINNIGTSTISGVLTTSSQPNINSVTSLNITGHNGTNGLSLGGFLVSATATQLNYLNVPTGVATALKALVLDADRNIFGLNTISSVSLSGVLTTASQPNIRSLQSINISDHNGITGLSLNGILVTANANQLNAMNVIPGNASVLKAMVLGSDGAISGISSLTSTNLYGTIRTPNQPHITSVNTLDIINHNGTTGLSLAGTMVTVSAEQINKLNVFEGLAASNKVMVLNSSNSITGINNIGASTISGVLTTSSQPNINSVTSLNITGHNGMNGLALGGILVTSSAIQLNRLNVITGVATAEKALVLDINSNVSGINYLSTNTISGVLTTTSQPNINSVNTLDITLHDGGSQGLRLNGILVNASATQLNYTNVIPGLATAGKALVTNNANSISGLNVLNVSKLVAGQLSLSGVISNFNTGGIIARTYSMTNFAGRVVDVQLLTSLSFQDFNPANMTNSYSTEIFGYILPAYSESYTFFVNCRDRIRIWVNDTLVLHSWSFISGYQSSSSIFLNANQWVKIYIQYQVDAIAQSLLNIQWVSPSTTRATIAGSNLAWDSNQPSNNIKHFTQNSMTIYNSSSSSSTNATFVVDTGGDLLIDASGNDINLGNDDSFSIPSHDGTRGLKLGNTLVEATALQLNYLKVPSGIATASKAMVLNGSKSITGLSNFQSDSISCTNLTAGIFNINNLTLSGPLNNYSLGSLLIRQITGPDVSGRIVHVGTINDINITNYDPTSLVNNYSLDILGYINPLSTDLYTFHLIVNDRARVWVNGVLILNIWDINTGIEYNSVTIPLTMGRWTPIYIQYQNIADNAVLSLRWSASTVTKSYIPSNNMAWDNSSVAIPRKGIASDSMTLYSSQSGLYTIQSGGLSVTNNGVLQLVSSSRNISTSPEHNFDITTHDGFTGLKLAGALVTASASDINRLTNIVPGIAQPGKVIVLDSLSSLSGLSNISCTNITGTLTSGIQPNITGFGQLTEPVITSSNIGIINADITFKIQSYVDAITSIKSVMITSNNSSNSSDIYFCSNVSNLNSSLRKFTIQSGGNIGIQTIDPKTKLCINTEGGSDAIRLIYNNSNGTETNYTTLGITNNGDFNILPSGETTRISSGLSIGKTSPTNITVGSSGELQINSFNGCVRIGNTTNNLLPLEIGSQSFTLSQPVGYINAYGSTGLNVISSSSYSLRTTSSIIVNGTVCITSDRRLKDNIESLCIERCKRFIMESNPVTFVYKNDKSRSLRCGLIAQDVFKSTFNGLVQFTPEESMCDNDGPKNASMNVSYTEIIPILMATIKDLYEKNSELESKIANIIER